MFDLSDKVVIITGASQGIGRTMAIVFGESGRMLFVLPDLKKIKVKLEIKIRKTTIPNACDIGDGNAFPNN